MGCYILIRTKDKVPQDHPSYHKLPQKWDVVTAIDEDGNFGRKVMASDDVIWIYCEDMTKEEVELHFMTPEPGDVKTNPNLRKKIITLDPEMFPIHFLEKISNNKTIDLKNENGEDHHFDIIYEEFMKDPPANLNKSELLKCRKVKPPIDNPFIVGVDPFEVK